ncbi:unnamed protein product [Orchesella dallaii]|uniref:Gustatory receptor n=1 Tax=Orchesella dallaii TaxID=48710 RepID=A0ABP1RD17_9HEXA
MDKLGTTFVFEVAKYLFVCGQHLAAAISLLMIPILSGRVTKMWNKLQQLVVQITSCYSAKCFIHVYRVTRLIIFLWVNVVVSSWYLWWKSFFIGCYFQTYFESSQGSISFYSHIAGCILMSTLISSHVLHSMFFIILAATLRMCFRTITRVATEHLCHLQTNNGHDQLEEKVSERKVCCELADAYRTTRKLVLFLGNIYGRYMVVEMFAFFSSALTSIFAMFDNFGAIRLETVLITLVINIIWFCGVCECGQMLLNEERKCFQSMKAIALRCDMPANWMIEKFMGVKPMGLTAANYFTFSRKLVTGAVVSLVTYLIVMLQFKAADKTNGLIVESSEWIRNATTTMTHVNVLTIN